MEVHEALKRVSASKVSIDGYEATLLFAPGVYKPDAWTEVLLQGVTLVLNQRMFKSVVVEVGVGSGIIPLCLLQRCAEKMERYIGLDLSPLAVEIARLNLSILAPAWQSRRLVGGLSALEGLPKEECGKVDLAFGNLPQLCSLKEGTFNTNDYYHHLPGSASGDEEDELVVSFGLGLVTALIRQARERLSSGGVVVSTVSHRSGQEPLRAFLDGLGGRHRRLFGRRIPQDPDTHIGSLVDAERELGFEAEFFRTAHATGAISAREALQIIQAGGRVYHDLCVYVFEAE